MKHYYFIGFLAFITVFSPVSAGLAEMPAGRIVVAEDERPDEGQAGYAAAYVAASRQQSLEPFWDLVHPASKACMSDEFRDVTALFNFSEIIKHPIPEDYVVQVKPVSEDEIRQFFALMLGEKIEIPVMPTHALSIHYSAGRGICPPVQSSRVMYVAEKDGAWFEAIPCPSALPFSLADMKKKMEEQDKATDAHLAALSQDDEDALKARLKEGDVITAMKDAAAKLGAPLGEAREVIEKLCVAE